MAATTMEKENVLEGKTTLVRRVSDLFRAEGNNNGSPLLLNHTSMQKLRHCCQNLNLFPILLYSFGQPKAPLMPVSKINLALLIARITERIYRVYSSIRYTAIKGLNLESMKPIGTAPSEKSRILSARKSVSEPEIKLRSSQSEQKFEKFQIRKRKESSLLLKLAVYLALLLLAFQLLAIFSLLVFGKYSPGFVFLLSALMFLGCISMKVLNHDTIVVKTFKRDKRKKQD